MEHIQSSQTRLEPMTFTVYTIGGPGSTQSFGLTARPVPGAATSARPGPRAVEPPLLRGPGRHPFPRPLPPTPPRLSSGSPPPPRAAPPRPAGAAVSGAAGPSAAATAAAAAAIRDNQGRPEDPETGLPGPRIWIPGCCGVWSGSAPGKPGTWMKEPNPGSRNARSHGARIRVVALGMLENPASRLNRDKLEETWIGEPEPNALPSWKELSLDQTSSQRGWNCAMFSSLRERSRKALHMLDPLLLLEPVIWITSLQTHSQKLRTADVYLLFESQGKKSPSSQAFLSSP
ncbi:uncharacterized protein [Callorhinus ursinus]|uniref:uncharacterized protein n=1 Tax=Callorhinus ursinus TaxID=34884 RepID=UPI003CD040F9